MRLDVVKCLLIAGPGFAKDSFREFLLDQANKAGNKELLAFKQNIVTAPASTAYLQGVEVCATAGMPSLSSRQEARSVSFGELSRCTTASYVLCCPYRVPARL